VAEKKWYVVHVYSGFEKKIAEQIKQQAAQKGLADKFDEVLVPTEQVTEVRRGQKVDTDRKYFPGYVLVKMEMTDDAWHLVKDTPKVTGFLGARNKPQPVPASEAQRLLQQVQEGVEKPRKPAVLFEVGEQVRVADGPFTSFNGVVEEVDEEKGRVKVSVSIFGRSTPVDLEYGQSRSCSGAGGAAPNPAGGGAGRPGPRHHRSRRPAAASVACTSPSRSTTSPPTPHLPHGQPRAGGAPGVQHLGIGPRPRRDEGHQVQHQRPQHIRHPHLLPRLAGQPFG